MPHFGEHDLIPLGVCTHREVGGFLGRIFRLAQNLATMRFDQAAAFKKIANLESHAGPCALRFAAAMNANQRIRDTDLADDVVLTDYFAIKRGCIESDGAVNVLGPDDVFNTLNLHSVTLAGSRRDAQLCVRRLLCVKNSNLHSVDRCHEGSLLL